MGVKVSLRKKKIAGDKLSLYLDFYPAIKDENGKETRRDFLKIHIQANPSSSIEKQHAQDMLKIAEGVRQKRELELNRPEIYSLWEQEQLKYVKAGNQSFITYFKELAWERTGGNFGNWISALKYLERFAPDDLLFKQIDVQLLEKLKKYLLTSESIKSEGLKLDQNSASSYFNKYKAALRLAFRDELIRSDYGAKVATIKPIHRISEYLTLEELQRLTATECEDETIKLAAIFSALTGLRFSDIKNLEWKNVSQDANQQYFVRLTIQKTRTEVVLPIADLAIELLHTRDKRIGKLIPGLKYSAHQNKKLHNWVAAAGIKKHITFHKFRHTYAALQLAMGTDLYTLSKMLVHERLSSTQIYAHLNDQLKIATTKLINLNIK